MVQRPQDGRDPGIAGAGLDRQRPLPHRRDHLLEIEHASLDLRPEAAHPGERQDHGVVVPAPQLGEPRIDVAAQVSDREVAPQRADLAGAPRAAGPDHRAAGEGGDPRPPPRDQEVVRVFAFRHAGDRQPFRLLRREVLQAVHRDVDRLREQGLLDLLHEDALSAQRRQGTVEDPVAGGVDGLETGGDAGGP